MTTTPAPGAFEHQYRKHLDVVCAAAEAALDRCGGFDGIVLHAGSPAFYHADDIEVPFRTVPHFARFAPVPGPDHLLRFRPGQPLKLVRVAPRDYWFAPPSLPPHPVVQAIAQSEAPDFAHAVQELGDVSGCAYVGNSPAAAAALGLPDEAVEPPGLMAALDWERGLKTPYEVTCLREAAGVAARGHAAAREAALAGAPEREVHAAYLTASGQLDAETPYPNIVAWDEAAAILHYQARRAAPPDPGCVLLIDAGGTAHGYASDVTRTLARAGAHPVFRAALDGMDTIQRRLVADIAPGASYVALHARALRAICHLLSELGVLRVSGEEAEVRGLGLPFFPHGLGHHLGLQVHDVGGRQTGPDGATLEPPPEHPYLRTTRDLAPGHVVTIEPGVYFIPLLLDPLRASPDAEAIDWSLVDALIPCGGIRIEDDVLVTESGFEDLTRSGVPRAPECADAC